MPDSNIRVSTCLFLGALATLDAAGATLDATFKATTVRRLLFVEFVPEAALPSTDWSDALSRPRAVRRARAADCISFGDLQIL